MKKVLVTGSNGQLGRAIHGISVDLPFEFVFASRTQLDISNETEVRDYFEKNHFDIVINCAAYTAVDLAETEIINCNSANIDAVKILAKACSINDSLLIHISSDYVYHPNHDNPISETGETNPKGIYASSKLKGEKIAFDNWAKTIVIRTSWVYSEYGKNFVKTINQLSANRDKLTVVNDQVGSPTYAEDIAYAIFEIIEKLNKSGEENFYGIYNFSNDGYISWFDFATEIVRFNQNKCQIIPVATEAYPTPTERPKNSRLDKTKIVSSFKIQLIPWQISLEKCLVKIKQNIDL